MIEFWIGAGSTIIFVTLGFFAGSAAERRHFARLKQKESELLTIIQSNSNRYLVPACDESRPPTLIVAETVIASDYFKNFLSQFRKFFGGELKSYHSLMDRARRETTVRLLETAKNLGYNAICNVRLETADIGGKAMVMVSILGTATAYQSNTPIEIVHNESNPNTNDTN